MKETKYRHSQSNFNSHSSMAFIAVKYSIISLKEHSSPAYQKANFFMQTTSGITALCIADFLKRYFYYLSSFRCVVFMSH